MALLREAIAQFLNPSAGEPVEVRAIVIDLVACDLEVHARGSGVRRDARPEIVRDFVVRDRDVLIGCAISIAFAWARIVQIDLTTDDLVGVNQ